MAGPNQHHIPCFLQRSFGVGPKGTRATEIWQFSKGEAPSLEKIKQTASEDFFYSEPSADGSPALDDRITRYETDLAPIHARVRKLPVGSMVDAKDAAELVAALAPRSAHVRRSLTAGTQYLLDRAGGIFLDPKRLETMFGFDQDRPNETFAKKFGEALDNNPGMDVIGLPGPVLERVAFYIAREKLDHSMDQPLGEFARMLERLMASTPEMVRDAHNKAVDQLRVEDTRRDLLAQFDWVVQEAPPEGAILPDCVALAWTRDDPVLPLMFAGQEMDRVVMPLSTGKLLVGRGQVEPRSHVISYNRDAASCAHEFFLARCDGEAISSLADLIDTRAMPYLEEAIQQGLGEIAVERSSPDRVRVDQPSKRRKTADGEVECQIMCRGFDDEAEARDVIEAVQTVVGGLADILPLGRLEAVVVAADYPAELRLIDRGIPGAPETATACPVIGEGVAMTVPVVRNGVVRARIVLEAYVGRMLTCEAPTLRDWALQMLAHQLALTATLDWVEDALPGVLLRTPEPSLEASLYPRVDAALNGYIASRISAAYGDSRAIAAIKRELLVMSLDRLRQSAPVSRLAYRLDGNFDALLGVVMPLIGETLRFAAELIGHCEASGEAICDEHDQPRKALTASGLEWWLVDYGEHLSTFFSKLGTWASFDDFTIFSRHVERLMWTIGIFPWDSPEGLRTEVPLVSDAAALEALAEQIRGAG